MSSLQLFSTKEPLHFISQKSKSDSVSSSTGTSTATSTTSSAAQTAPLEELATGIQTDYSSVNLQQDTTGRASIQTQTQSELSLIRHWLSLQTPESKQQNKESLKHFLNGSETNSAVKRMKRVLDRERISLNYDVNWNEEVKDVALIYNYKMESMNQYTSSGTNSKPGSSGGVSTSGTSTGTSSGGHTNRNAHLKVGLLVWNELGYLAVSYEPKSATTGSTGGSMGTAAAGEMGWCMDSGLILVKRSFNQQNSTSSTTNVSRSANNDIRIEITESIVTAMDFYPGRGNILAAGTYDGTLKVWKLGKDMEKLICESKVHELYSHRDPISQIAWLKTRADRSIVLASMSTEGRLSLWTVKNDFMQPVSIFMLNDIERGGIAFGVTCFSFSNIHAGASIRSMNRTSIIPTTDNYFIFGTEVGRVARGTLTGGKLIDTKAFTKGASLPETKPKNNGIEFEYDTGVGYVHQVECSPYHKNLFMSISSEGLVRIFNVYQSTDILTLQPSEQMLYDAQWSPFRPCVLAAGGEDGHLYIYDLTESTVTPAIDIQVSTHPVTQVKFDPENPEQIATGDAEGFIKVWRLNNRLSSLQPHELATLQSIEAGGVSSRLDNM